MAHDWQHLQPMGQGEPWPTTPQVVPRSQLDGQRMAVRAPYAEYPSGYLGTLNTRRDDRLLQALSRRQAARSYTRGVHAGSRARPEGYLWPKEFGPQNGIMAQSQGMKQRPLLELAPPARLTNDGKPTADPTAAREMPRGAAGLMDLKRFKPPWA